MQPITELTQDSLKRTRNDHRYDVEDGEILEEGEIVEEEIARRDIELISNSLKRKSYDQGYDREEGEIVEEFMAKEKRRASSYYYERTLPKKEFHRNPWFFLSRMLIDASKKGELKGFFELKLRDIMALDPIDIDRSVQVSTIICKAAEIGLIDKLLENWKREGKLERIFDFVKKSPDTNAIDVSSILNALSKAKSCIADIKSFYNIFSCEQLRKFIASADPQSIANIFNAISKIDDRGVMVKGFYQSIDRHKLIEITKNAKSIDIAQIFNALSKIKDDDSCSKDFYQKFDDKKWMDFIEYSDTACISVVLNALSKINDSGLAVKNLYRKISNVKLKEIVENASAQNIANIFNALSKTNETNFIKELFLKIDRSKTKIIIEKSNYIGISSILNALSKIQDDGKITKDFYENISRDNWARILVDIDYRNIVAIFNSLSKIQDNGIKVKNFYDILLLNNKKIFHDIGQRGSDDDICLLFNALGKIQDDGKTVDSFYCSIRKNFFENLSSFSLSQISLIFNALSKVRDNGDKVENFYRNFRKNFQITALLKENATKNVPIILNALSKINDDGLAVRELYESINDEIWEDILSNPNPQVIRMILNALTKISDARYIEDFYKKINYEKLLDLLKNSSEYHASIILNSLSKIKDEGQLIKQLYERIGSELVKKILHQPNHISIGIIFNSLSKIQDEGKIVENFYRELSYIDWKSIISQMDYMSISRIINALSKIKDQGFAVKKFSDQITTLKWSEILINAKSKNIGNIINGLSKIRDSGQNIIEFYNKISDEKWDELLKEKESQSLALIFKALSVIKFDKSFTFNFYNKIKDKNLLELDEKSNARDFALIISALGKIEYYHQVVEEFYRINSKQLDKFLKDANSKDICDIINALSKIKDQGKMVYSFYKYFSKLSNFKKQTEKFSVIEIERIFNALCEYKIEDEEINQYKLYLIDQHYKKNSKIKSCLISPNFSYNLLNFYNSLNKTSSHDIFASKTDFDLESIEELIDDKMEIDSFEKAINKDTECGESQIDQGSLISVKSFSSLSSDKIDIETIELTATGNFAKKTSSVLADLSEDQLKSIRSQAMIINFSEVLANNSLLYTGNFYSSNVGDSEKSFTHIKTFDEDGQHTIIVKDIVVKFENGLDETIINFLRSKKILWSDNSIRKLLKKSDLSDLPEEQEKIASVLLDNKSRKYDDKEEFIIFDDRIQSNIKVKEQLGEELFNKMIARIRKVKLDQYLQEIDPTDDKSFSQQIIKEINNPRNNFVRYIDPNNLKTVCEISWQNFEQRIRKKKAVTGVYKTAQSIQYQKFSDIEQKGSTCFLIALSCLSNNNSSLKKLIEFIHQNESSAEGFFPEISSDSVFKDTLTAHQKTHAIKIFKEKCFILEDGRFSLLNIINEKEEVGVDKMLKAYLKPSVCTEIQTNYERYQRIFLDASIFVLQYYLKNLKDKNDEEEIDENNLYEEFKDFKERSKLNHDTLDKLSFKLSNLYKAISKIQGLKDHNYKCKVELPKSLILKSQSIASIKK